MIGVIVSICIQGIVSDWMDVLSIYICPLGAGLAGIMFFWVYGKNYVEAQVNLGRDKKSPLVRRVYDWVQEQYDEGRITIISDAELTRQTELAMEAE